MTRRVFRNIAMIAVLAVLATSVLLVLVMHDSYIDGVVAELHTEAKYIVRAMDMLADDEAYLQGLGTTSRVTHIAADGTVLYDSVATAEGMENHGQREEVEEAMHGGIGESRRYSDTLSETTLYAAQRAADGSVIRIASTRSSTFGALINVLPEISILILAVVVAALLIARVCAGQIVAPINALDLTNPLENDSYDELAPLLTRMDHQNRQLRRQMLELEQAKTESTAIIDNMREGLILLDRKNTVLAMNGSAALIFGVEKQTGEDMMNVCRDHDVTMLIQGAQEGQANDLLVHRKGRKYRLFASPVEQQETVRGVVLMIVDVTEHYAAEASRREFTANVSHELKTPLTTISGYAEIIRDGIAQPQAIPSFAGKIFDESKRLITLVNDILELSRLDEKQGLGVKVPVDLLPILQELVGEYEPAANGKKIEMKIEGQAAKVNGYPILLREMMQNLIDNAIKYTPEGGSVAISLKRLSKSVFFTVADSGIGIPHEHHERIFERFYRVDKSHSRATGGTGLGLSIVKHVAEIHDAHINLKSEVGEGTTISVALEAI